MLSKDDRKLVLAALATHAEAQRHSPAALAADQLAQRLEQGDGCAVLAFQPEAYDTAAMYFQRAKGLTVNVVPATGEAFDAELVDVDWNEAGEPVAKLAPWDEDAGKGDRDKMRTLTIYGDLQRLEVL